MRILHVSDSHLGFSQFPRLTPDGLNQREQDVFDAFRAAVDHALRERPDVVVHSGDLFDAVRPTNRAVAFAMSEVQRLADAGIPFFVISGNHDTPKLRETGSVLRCLEFLPNVRAVFRNEAEAARYGDLALVGVPQADSQEAYERLLDAAQPVSDARYNVLVLHAGVIGVADFRGGEFNELTVTHDRLARTWDYIALGHYHGHVDVASNAAYAGSTERMSLREAGDEKGVVLVDLATGARRFLPVPARPMQPLPSLDARDLGPFELTAAIVARLRDAAPAGKILSLKIRNAARPAYAGVDFAQVRRAGEGAVNVSLAWEFAETEAVVLPASGAARSLGDEFDAFVEGVPLTVDRDRLRALAREVLSEAGAR